MYKYNVSCAIIYNNVSDTHQYNTSYTIFGQIELWWKFWLLIVALALKHVIHQLLNMTQLSKSWGIVHLFWVMISILCLVHNKTEAELLHSVMQALSSHEAKMEKRSELFVLWLSSIHKNWRFGQICITEWLLFKDRECLFAWQL